MKEQNKEILKGLRNAEKILAILVVSVLATDAAVAGSAPFSLDIRRSLLQPVGPMGFQEVPPELLKISPDLIPNAVAKNTRIELIPLAKPIVKDFSRNT